MLDPYIYVIWVRSRRSGCLVTWFCYHLLAKPGTRQPHLHDLTHIYIIITKNIRYLLWNQGLWCSLNNTYPIFLTPCIRCTNHLCDSCDLTDVNWHLSRHLSRHCSEWFKMLTYSDVINARAGCQQLWRHNDWLFPRGCYGRFLSTMMRTMITAQWTAENISCFNFFA